MSDEINHPDHYTQGGIECIECIAASLGYDGFLSYCQGNVIKYLWRWRDKGGIQDLKKAKWYLNRMISRATTRATFAKLDDPNMDDGR